MAPSIFLSEETYWWTRFLEQELEEYELWAFPAAVLSFWDILLFCFEILLSSAIDEEAWTVWKALYVSI